MHQKNQKLKGFLSGVLTLILSVPTLGGLTVHAATVTCESENGKRSFCSVDTSGGVSLKKKLSSAGCRRGKTWGYTDRGIWVKQGCRAQFFVGEPLDDGENNEGLSMGKKVAIGAGVAGLAGLGYYLYKKNKNSGADTTTGTASQQAYGQLSQSNPSTGSSQPYPPPNYSSSHNYNPQPAPSYSSAAATTQTAATLYRPIPNPYDLSEVPQWAQGQFQGYDSLYQVMVNMTIEPNGLVSRNVNNRIAQGHYQNGILSIGGVPFQVVQQGNGFRIVHPQNPNHSVVFQRR